MKSTILHVSKMHCASCVPEIESTLNSLEGVQHAQLNFATGKAQIDYDSSKVTVEAIIASIEKLGYGATYAKSSHSHNHGDTATNKEIQKKLYKFLFGAFISITLILIDFVLSFSGEGYVAMGLTALVLLFTGSEFFTRGIPPFVLKGRPNMDTLVSLGVGAAFLYSSYNTLFTSSHDMYFMDAAIIATFIILGRYLEEKSKGKAKEAVQKLLSLGAKEAHLIKGKRTTDIPIEQVKINYSLLVKPGEKVPVDGVIIEGNPIIDESMVTGESMPVTKILGEEVIGATINTTSPFTMKATKVGEGTLLAQMVKLIEDAQMHKAPIQHLVDTISRYFVWLVVLVALTTFLSWSLLLQNPQTAILSTIAVLIIACPCALGLATPISIVVGSGKGAENGILLKDARALEKVHTITTMCFDKTGTITEGKPKVTDFLIPDDSEMNQKEVISHLASLEFKSEHPLASAVVSFAKNKEITLLEVTNIETTTGGGIEGHISDTEVHVGSESYISEKSSIPLSLSKKAAQLMKGGKTVIYGMVNKKVVGAFALLDTPKREAHIAINALKRQGIRTIMITGDNEQVARTIAKQVGVDEIHANIRPESKVSMVKKLQEEGHTVAMIGDGINDAPALATADIGIAMGTGTDIAIESGDLVLVKGDITKAVDALLLSRATISNIKQNLFWAFAYNTIGIPVAAFGLLNPIFSAFAMAFSSISVVLNALRLRKVKLLSK